MASSTTSPAARINAISDSTLSENPNRYMTAKVPTSDTGTASAGISAVRRRPRNRNTSTMTRPTAISSVRSASCSVARITGERSMAMFRSTLPGMIACRAGSSRRMPSMVSMMLAPAWRLTISNTACSLLKKPLL